MQKDSPLPENAIEARALRKVYKGDGRRPPKVALDGVDLAIPRGSFFGLLGPNGAGKSTFINIFAGLVNKTGGTACVWGHDLDTEKRAARTAIGVVPQEINFDPFFTPFELLEVQAGMYGVPAHERRTAEILDAMGLGDKAHAYARALSGGMRRRLLVAKAMVHAPPVLVLDEPTAGVDIELRQQLWEYVQALNAAGTTILLTTHYLEEAEKLCDRIAIINNGAVVACEPTRTLLRRLDSKSLSITVDRELDMIPEALQPFHPELRSEERRLTFFYKPSQVAIDRILSAIHEAGLMIVDLTTEETDLEDIFLQLTRRPQMETQG